MACLIVPPCIVSQVTSWSQVLIPAPVFLVATPPQSCFEIKSCFQQAAFKAHLLQTQGHKLWKEIHNKLLPWATEQSTWLQMLGWSGSVASHFFSAFPSINLCPFRNNKSNTQDLTYAFQANHRPGGVFTQCPQSKDTFSSKTNLQSIKLSKHDWCHHFSLLES